MNDSENAGWYPTMRLVTRWSAALQKHSEPVQKITIVPRTMGALGYVMQTPEEEKFLDDEKRNCESDTGRHS